MTEAVIERPQESSTADITLVTRGITVAACVEVSTEFALVLRPTGDGNAWKTSVKPGDPVELFWVGGYEERTLPAKITEVEDGEDPRWHLAVTGPVTRSQRRRAVRAWVELPVLMPWAGATLSGKTLDLSEAGTRVLVDGWGLPPDAGVRAEISITLDDRVVVDLRAEIVRHQLRGAQWILAMRFLDVAEREEDRLRKRVFQALREHRTQLED